MESLSTVPPSFQPWPGLWPPRPCFLPSLDCPPWDTPNPLIRGFSQVWETPQDTAESGWPPDMPRVQREQSGTFPGPMHMSLFLPAGSARARAGDAAQCPETLSRPGIQCLFCLWAVTSWAEVTGLPQLLPMRSPAVSARAERSSCTTKPALETACMTHHRGAHWGLPALRT